MYLLALLMSLATAPAPAPHLQLQTEITAETVAPLVEALGSATGRVVLEINSPGGEVDAGWTLARAIERSPAHVVCVVDGEADSMAAVVLQSCQERLMTERSVLMFHEPGGAVRGQPRELENALRRMRLMTQQLVRHCARRMHMPWRRLARLIEGGRELWLGPDEALKMHAVDGVVDAGAF